MNPEEIRAAIRRHAQMQARQMEAIQLIMEAREAAEAKFPDQHLEQGTGPMVPLFKKLPGNHITHRHQGSVMLAADFASAAKLECQAAGTRGNPVTWAKVIGEEFGEYIEASGPADVKKELGQLGAMVLRALEDIVASEEAPG